MMVERRPLNDSSNELTLRKIRSLSATRYRLIAAITLLSIGHHIDHVVRGVTGWPFTSEFNAFSASLVFYPVIALGVLVPTSRRAGALF